MIREDRYLVIKRKHLSGAQLHSLIDVLRQWHVPKLEALVIESDWPEYAPALAMLAARVDSATAATQGTRILTCVYCGHEYPQDTPASGSAVLTNHIEVCTKHPMKRAIDDRDRMRRALEGLLGTDDPVDLKRLEAAIRQEAAPSADKAAAVDAVHALLAYYEAQASAETHHAD